MIKVKERAWATLGDKEVSEEELPNENHTHWGHDPSSEAIGGYYGIEWYEYFQDSKTNEVYKVRCTDGVYKCRGPHKPEKKTTPGPEVPIEGRDIRVWKDEF